VLTEQKAARHEQLIRDYYIANDEQDWEAIESFFAPTMEFRVGNNEGTHDFEVLKTSVQANLKSSEVTEMLHLGGTYLHDPRGRICVSEIEVRLARADGRSFVGPCCAIFGFDEQDRIESYRAYLDVGDFWH
jgi:hypothetical protein